jgi:Uma2 family endonuclease
LFRFFDDLKNLFSNRDRVMLYLAINLSFTGSETGRRNLDLEGQFWYWNKQYKLGIVFDSSTGFTFSNGAKRSPDVSWITIDRWNSLSLEEKKGFAPIAPDFVLELKSPTDSLVTLQNKMSEYISNGVRLGWLINPETKQVEIYKSGKVKEVLKNSNSISNNDILPRLVIELDAIWE